MCGFESRDRDVYFGTATRACAYAYKDWHIMVFFLYESTLHICAMNVFFCSSWFRTRAGKRCDLCEFMMCGLSGRGICSEEKKYDCNGFTTKTGGRVLRRRVAYQLFAKHARIVFAIIITFLFIQNTRGSS